MPKKKEQLSEDLAALSLDDNAGNGARKKKRGVDVVVQEDEGTSKVGEQELHALGLN